MIHLIYVSSATRPMGEQDLLDLLEQSRSRNLRQQVTGMLVYRDGAFLQVLEGESADVQDIYRSIVMDNRNTGHYLIAKEEITDRNFSNWSMGFKDLTKYPADQLEGYSDILVKGASPDKIAKYKDMAVSLLLHF
jgi:hypothetical protein